MAAMEQHVRLARALPRELRKLFASYRPPQIVNSMSHTSRADGDSETDASREPSIKNPGSLNPFQPHKHPETGRWHPPIYSLRRQAELVKLSKLHGVDDLLPFTVKATAERQKRREEHGLRVQGTGAGQRVKGHLWERTMKGRLEKRRTAMLEMPQMKQQWRQRGRGRGWKKWPK